MSPHLVDTDYVVDVLNNRETAIRLLMELAPQGLAVSMLSYAELYEGAYYARNPEAALAALESFLKGKTLLPVSLTVVRRFAVLRGSLTRAVRQQAGDLDLRIAATALAFDLTLLTHNLRDFQLVPGLRLYQPG